MASPTRRPPGLTPGTRDLPPTLLSLQTPPGASNCRSRRALDTGRRLTPRTTIRSRLLRQIEQRLRRDSLPRLEMSLMVGLSGLSALLFSYLMLRWGADSMALRYPAAVLLAYGVFLGLLRIWLAIHARREQAGDPTETPDALDALDAVDFGVDVGRSLSRTVDSTDSALDAADGVVGALDLDALAFLVLALVAAAAGIVACAYVIWSAPMLLAELVVDGILIAGLHRHWKKHPPVEWWSGAVRRTWIPAVVVALFFGVSGFALGKLAPGAPSIGPALHALRAR